MCFVVPVDNLDERRECAGHSRRQVLAPTRIASSGMLQAPVLTRASLVRVTSQRGRVAARALEKGKGRAVAVGPIEVTSLILENT